MKATPKQTWFIFCNARIDVRACNITVEQASGFITRLKAGDASVIQEIAALPGAVVKGNAKLTPKEDWQALYNEAHNAGMLAGQSYNPTPMVVQGHANPMDDNSPVTQRWVVNEGVCGFAEIHIRPGTCSFAKWLSKQKLGSKSYYGGVSIWVGLFGQSMERKEAYAQAFAQVLKSKGINAYASSRMD